MKTEMVIQHFEDTVLGPFVYRALDSPQDTTRLFRLQPAQFSDPVSVEVSHETYLNDKGVPYECLSYAWGDLEGQEDVHICYTTSQEPALLRCRPNLVNALRYLRHTHQARVIWADAICIDQKNTAERSRLVAHMGEIYKHAMQVVIWLGQEDKGTVTALRTIETLSAGIELHWDHRTCETIAASEAETVERRFAESVIQPDDWKSLNELILRPWFKRLWVRQEVQLASKVVLRCGRLEIDWGKMEKVMIFLEQKVNRIYFQTADIVRCRSLFPHEGSDSLTYALHRSSFCECTDARDRVYANLSTSSAIKALDIEPDYTLSVAETFKNLTIKYVQHFQDLDLLRMCDLDSLPSGFMSFVPEFGTSKSQSRLCSVCAHAGTRQSFSFKEDGSVGVKGRWIDVVRTVSPARKQLVEDNSAGGNYAQIIETYRQWEPDDLMTNLGYPGGGSLLDAFVLLLANASDKEINSSSHLPTSRQRRASFLAAFASGGDLQQIHSPQHKEYLRELTSDRRPEIFFRTQQGYIGTSSSQVHDGDSIVVLLGASVPMVLRPSKERQGAYQVVGPCYLQGVMFGEALLGSLPDGWHFLRDNRRRWCFKKQSSGTTTREDPRLWPLPEHWVTHHCSFDEEENLCAGSCGPAYGYATESFDRWFFNKYTSERSKCDPRLDTDGLESGGMSLDEFVLV